ncbi:MFS transporter [Halospeciosus flavus]|uniref:MFS transporter n=1 Tax=Halospeciosus flavus TaxID=3032283 RepID=A0ABD5Z654_9EURY|nr:MFS transporter [Halospeciosus flavus]
MSGDDVYETKIPARMDRLPWSRWHWKVILALGVTWLLDGMEVTLVGALAAALTEPSTLGLTSGQVGLAASVYLVGAVAGALVFGRLTDKYGRKKLFFATLTLYFLGVGLTALSWSFWSFAFFRLITGMGIGGEYSAIYSAIDELIPARARGHADLAISGSYWIGAALASAMTVFFLNKQFLTSAFQGMGWRLVFATGAVLALFVLFLRRFVPESPRWLMVHGREEEAEEIVSNIEAEVEEQTGVDLEEPADEKAISIAPIGSIPLRTIARTMFREYPRRAVLCFTLIVTQAFLYNAIFFTYGLILKQYYGIPSGETGLYLIPFAAGNFVGAVLLGRWFDTVGRRPMIAATYGISGILLTVTGFLFINHLLSAVAMTVLWSVIFFFASPAASSAYLTASEVFPLETRAQAIAVFYAIGTGVGGVVAPAIFGRIIGTGSRTMLFAGYVFAAALMLVAAVVGWKFGVDAEQEALEDISSPLSSAE